MGMLRTSWQKLPPRTARLLRIGSLGQQHLQAAAATAGAEAREDLAAELLFAAWEQNPLNGPAAAAALQAGGVPAGLEPLLQVIARGWRAPASGSRYQQLAEAGGHEQAFAEARERFEGEPGLFWAEQLLALGTLLGRDVGAHELVLASPLAGAPGLKPLVHFLEAERHFLLENWDAAQERYGGLDAHWLPPAERRAEALLHLERGDEAQELWREALRLRPWHASLLLRVHSHVAPLDEVGHLPDTAALIYTWNKADYLDGALAALAGSRGVARIVALDNGSTDATPEVLEAWMQRLGCECLEVHTLPVNIGAPAARNWLASLPCVQDMECVAYLDDDAVPPPDWLEQLHAARQAFPGATAWGCCVVDHQAPRVIQSADFHILPGAPGADADAAAFDLQRVHAQPFHISTLQSQTPDRGQFRYLRPCLSVTGCCHLLDVAELQQGGFDLRFTPSQYDDVERDLRRAVAGKHCIYQGALMVGHCKQSGKGAAMSAPALGNWLANRYKLMHRFEPQQVQELWERQAALLQEDLESRFPDLEQALGLG